MCSQWGEGNKLLPDTSGGRLSPLRTKQSNVGIQQMMVEGKLAQPNKNKIVVPAKVGEFVYGHLNTDE